MNSIWKKDVFMSSVNNLILDLPSSKNLSYNWNFGSLLGMILVIQILTGIVLSFFYAPNVLFSFNCLSYIMRDINFGWLFRMIHLNMASFFFMIMYFHMSRGMYFMSYRLIHTWGSGVTIYIVLMATAFMGYVLPWGQMSLWGATVITNFVSTIPILGETIVKWIWGGFSVNNSTLNCFFSLHFLLPFVLLALVMVHLIFLHYSGSTSPNIGSFSKNIKIKFDNYFIYKDMVNINLLFMMIFVTLFIPFDVGDPENFILANPMNSPIHIQPEWYFLYIYGILRSIPNKLGGVLVMVMALLMYYILIFSNKTIYTTNFIFYKMFYWMFIYCFILLTWIGSQAVENPFIFMGQLLTFLYFLYFFMVMFMSEFLFILYNK